MQIDDIGFIIFIKKYEENSLLIKILSKNNGLIAGYITKNKYNKIALQIGNLVSFTWFAKNLTQLGSLKLELIKSHISLIIMNKFYIAIMESITTLLTNLIYENFILDERIFLAMENILLNIINASPTNKILREYLIFENLLLNELNSGIVITTSQLDELHYVSPKTGLAVSKERGEPFADKLLLFPLLFKCDEYSREHIDECFIVIDFFLRKNLMDMDEKKRNNILYVRKRLRDEVNSSF